MSFKQTALPPLDSTFSDYHREFYAALNKSQQAIQASANQDLNQVSQCLNDADQHITEATDLFKTLEMESQSQDLTTRNKLRPYVTEGRTALSDARKTLRAARVATSQRRDLVNRDELLQRGGDVRIDMSDTTAQIEKSNEVITDSRRHIAETELVGASILEDLLSQRNTISRARQNVGNMSTGLDQSDTILNTMQRRALVNRILVYIVLVAIGISCLAVIYVRMFHSNTAKRH